HVEAAERRRAARDEDRDREHDEREDGARPHGPRAYARYQPSAGPMTFARSFATRAWKAAFPWPAQPVSSEPFASGGSAECTLGSARDDTMLSIAVFKFVRAARPGGKSSVRLGDTTRNTCAAGRFARTVDTQSL